MSDRQLIELFQSKVDRQRALAELFERYGPVTYAFLRRRIGDAEIAAEVNQDLFISVLESLDKFRGDASFKTWLFRMAHNRVSNLRRRWRVHLDELPDAAPDELAEELAASGESRPDETFEIGERQRALQLCLAGLTEIQRGVVLGQYYENVTLEELTARFAMTNKSGARAALIAAQRKLRRCLERSGVGEAE